MKGFKKSNLVDTFNRRTGLNIPDNTSTQAALKYIKQIGEDYKTEQLKPFYTHNVKLAPYLLQFIKAYARKYRDVYRGKPAIATLLMSIFDIQQHPDNFSELVTFEMIETVTNEVTPATAKNHINRLRKAGYIERLTYKQVKHLIQRTESNKQKVYYKLTGAGVKEVKKMNKNIFNQYKEALQDELHRDVLNVNYSRASLIHARALFNVRKKDLNVHRWQTRDRLNLIVKDFENRFPDYIQEPKTKDK